MGLGAGAGAWSRRGGRFFGTEAPLVGSHWEVLDSVADLDPELSLDAISVADLSLADGSVAEVSLADLSVEDYLGFGDLSLDEVSVDELFLDPDSHADQPVVAHDAEEVTGSGVLLGLPHDLVELRIEDEPLARPTPLVLASQVLPGAWPDRTTVEDDDSGEVERCRSDASLGVDSGSGSWSPDVASDVELASRSNPELEDYLDDAPITDHLADKNWVSSALMDRFSDASESVSEVDLSFPNDDWLGGSSSGELVDPAEGSVAERRAEKFAAPAAESPLEQGVEAIPEQEDDCSPVADGDSVPVTAAEEQQAVVGLEDDDPDGSGENSSDQSDDSVLVEKERVVESDEAVVAELDRCDPTSQLETASRSSPEEFPTERVSLEDLKALDLAENSENQDEDSTPGSSEVSEVEVAPEVSQPSRDVEEDLEDVATVCGEPVELGELFPMDAADSGPSDAVGESSAPMLDPSHKLGDEVPAVEEPAPSRMPRELAGGESLDSGTSTKSGTISGDTKRPGQDMGPPIMDRALSGAWQTVDAVVESLRYARARAALSVKPNARVWMSLVGPDGSGSRAAQGPGPTCWLELGGPQGAVSSPGARPPSGFIEPPPLGVTTLETSAVPVPPPSSDEGLEEVVTSSRAEPVPLSPGSDVGRTQDVGEDTLEEQPSVEHLLVFEETGTGGAEVTLDGSEEAVEDSPDVVAEGGAIRVALSLGSDEPPERATATRGVAVAPAEALPQRTHDTVDGITTTDLVALARTTGELKRMRAPVDDVPTDDAVAPTRIPSAGDDWLDEREGQEPTLGDDAES